MNTKIASWNVNGIRACHKKGFLNWLNRSRNDIVLLQEVRAEVEQIPKEVLDNNRYQSYWFPAKSKKGYSGVGILSKEEPLKVSEGIGFIDYDMEGRVLSAEFKDFIVVSAYFPNSQDGGRRLGFKVEFCKRLHEWLNKKRKTGKVVILGGDYNIAHKEIDLTYPETNEDSPGYFPEERAWMTEFLSSGWIDTFRYLYPKKVRYSWWSMRTRARDRNIGWRIDYHTVHEKDKERIIAADIKTKVLGSDHCPVSLEINLS